MFRLIAAVSILCLIVSGDLDDYETRIVNGRGASINEFPFLVSIQRRNGSHFCGGSILNDQWILTAGHCVYEVILQDQVDSLMIRAGSSNWNSGGVLKSVELAKIHEKYNHQTLKYDVAVLKILGKLIYSVAIKAVHILKFPLQTNRRVVVSGWGQLNDTKSQLSTTVQAVEMKILSLGACAKLHGRSVSDSMICAMGRGKDACRGDSGGPLTVPETMNQVGVVSWGVKCGDEGLPGVYAELANKIIMAFLKRHVGKIL